MIAASTPAPPLPHTHISIKMKKNHWPESTNGLSRLLLLYLWLSLLAFKFFSLSSWLVIYQFFFLGTISFDGFLDWSLMNRKAKRKKGGGGDYFNLDRFWKWPVHQFISLLTEESGM